MCFVMLALIGCFQVSLRTVRSRGSLATGICVPQLANFPSQDQQHRIPSLQQHDIPTHHFELLGDSAWLHLLQQGRLCRQLGYLCTCNEITSQNRSTTRKLPSDTLRDQFINQSTTLPPNRPFT